MQGGPTHFIAESHCAVGSWNNFSLKQEQGVRTSKAPVLPGFFFASRAGLSSPDSQCIVGLSFAPHRRRGRPLFARTHVPVDEPLGVLRESVVGIEYPFERLAGDVLGHVSGPALDRVEGDHAESIAVLAGEKIADDGLAIGLGGVGLVIGDAKLPVVVQTR